MEEGQIAPEVILIPKILGATEMNLTNHDNGFGIEIPEGSLPLISKIYDFNPDHPSYEKCLLDPEDYRKIIGRIKEAQQSTPHKYVVNQPDYGIDYESQFNGMNRLYTTKNVNTAQLLTDAFGMEKYGEFQYSDEKSQYSSRAMSLNQTQNFRRDDENAGNHEDISLIKTTEYV